MVGVAVRCEQARSAPESRPLLDGIVFAALGSCGEGAAAIALADRATG